MRERCQPDHLAHPGPLLRSRYGQALSSSECWIHRPWAGGRRFGRRLTALQSYKRQRSVCDRGIERQMGRIGDGSGEHRRQSLRRALPEHGIFGRELGPNPVGRLIQHRRDDRTEIILCHRSPKAPNWAQRKHEGALIITFVVQQARIGGIFISPLAQSRANCSVARGARINRELSRGPIRSCRTLRPEITENCIVSPHRTATDDGPVRVRASLGRLSRERGRFGPRGRRCTMGPDALAKPKVGPVQCCSCIFEAR